MEELNHPIKKFTPKRGQTVSYNFIKDSLKNLTMTDEINFKGSVSTVNLISEHSKQKMKIQNKTKVDLNFMNKKVGTISK